MMNGHNQEGSKALSSSSVQLEGFAPAAGSGAGSASSMSAPMAAMKSTSASAAAEAGGAGGGGAAGLQSIATTTTTTASSSTMEAAATATPSSAVATTQTNRAKKRGTQQPQRGPRATTTTTAAAASSTSTTASAAAIHGRASENYHDFAEETALLPLSDVTSDFRPITLPQIQLRLKNLLQRLPKELPNVPPPSHADQTDRSSSGTEHRYDSIQSFASDLQIAIEEYNLLLSLISSATYKWGVDRSGASQQNLAVMSAELQQCQDVIANVVSARLSNVLCPAVDVLVGEVEVVRVGGAGGAAGEGGGRRRDDDDDDEETIIRNGGTARGEEMEEDDDGRESTRRLSSSAPPAAKRIQRNEDRLAFHNNTNHYNHNRERRINHYARPLVDPSYVHLCHCILARNAPLIRHAVATSIYTAHRVIGDYIKAMKKDDGHDAGKGGYY